MPISLPNSPTNGQTVQIGTVVYTYDATAGVWNSEFESGVSSIVHTSDTAPLNPTDGDIWFDSSIGKTFIWYNDGTSSQWIQMNPNTGGSGGANLGSVSESIIPDTDITYDLGSSSKKFKDLYLSGSTLNLGNQSISATATGIVVPEIQIGSGTNNVKLTTNASGNLITTETDSSGNSGAASPAGGAATIVADMAGLIALTGMAAGSQAYVSANNRLYFYTGSGWYLIATVQNDAPSAITGVDGSYTLALDGTATTITAVSTDPEGFALTWSYTASGLGSIATVSRADNVFTVTPSTDAANAGSFTLTISATDGINGAVSTIPSFSLQFSVTNSRYTALSVKATNTGSNQTFDDASASNHTITVAGNSTASTFSPHRHGGYAFDFDGTNDFLTIPDSTDFDIASDADFTLELWGFYRSFATQSHFVDTRGTSQGVFLTCSVGGGGSDDGKIKFYTNSGNRIVTASTVPLNSWVHIALVRYSGTTKIYINGTADSNTYSDTNTYIALDWNIGKRSPIQTGSYMEGLFSDYRFVNGTAVYTSNFAPPTEPLTAITNTKLLLGNLPYFKDQSASNHTITVGGNTSLKPKSLFDNAPYSEASHGASAYFDGTGDYISVANHADFNFGSGNFTIESYVYYSAQANQAIVAQWHTATDRRAWQLRRDNGGPFRFYWSTTGADFPYIASTGIDLNTMNNQWIHVAVVRNGNTITMYVDGTDVVNTTLTGSLYDNTSDDIFIGARSTNPPNIDHQTEGYIQDLRITKGTAVYTSNFTPPTAPLTAITNTKFLLNPETSISDLSQRNALICRGDLETSTTQVKFAGTKSIYFDGYDDYIHVPNSGTNSAFSLNSTKFTIEGWFYKETLVIGGNWQTIVNSWRYPDNLGWRFKQNTNGTFEFRYSTNGISSSALTSTGTLGTGVWAHLALVANDDLKLYINGVGEVLSASALPAFFDTSYDALIGALRYDSTDNNDGAKIMEYNGWMQDLRIHNNHAQYTANFTPPTAELEG